MENKTVEDKSTLNDGDDQRLKDIEFTINILKSDNNYYKKIFSNN